MAANANVPVRRIADSAYSCKRAGSGFRNVTSYSTKDNVSEA